MSFDGVRTAAAADPGSARVDDVDEAPGELSAVRERPSAGAARPVRRWSPGRVLTLLAVAALVAACLRVFVVQAFVIPTGSMRPTLEVGDRVLVSRLDYRLGPVRRGDVIVFDGEGVFDAPSSPPRNPLVAAGRRLASVLGAPIGENDYVKRVIGLPGERIACCDTSGRITVNGVSLDEPYLRTAPASRTRFDIRVPRGRYWVMGDNRDDSGDSRAHLSDPGGGTVPEGHVVGRVVSVWWPFGRATGIGRVNGSAGAQEGVP